MVINIKEMKIGTIFKDKDYDVLLIKTEPISLSKHTLSDSVEIAIYHCVNLRTGKPFCTNEHWTSDFEIIKQA